MKSAKMEKFQEKGLKDLSALSLNESEMSGVQGGVGPGGIIFGLTLTFTCDWKHWFNGSLFTDGVVDEFD